MPLYFRILHRVCSLSQCYAIQSTGNNHSHCNHCHELSFATTWQIIQMLTRWSCPSHWKCSSRSITTDIDFECTDMINDQHWHGIKLVSGILKLKGDEIFLYTLHSSVKNGIYTKIIIHHLLLHNEMKKKKWSWSLVNSF